MIDAEDLAELCKRLADDNSAEQEDAIGGRLASQNATEGWMTARGIDPGGAVEWFGTDVLALYSSIAAQAGLGQAMFSLWIMGLQMGWELRSDRAIEQAQEEARRKGRTS